MNAPHRFTFAGCEHALGWLPSETPLCSGEDPALAEALPRLRRSIPICARDGRYGFAISPTQGAWRATKDDGGIPVVGLLPACRMEDLGDVSFCEDHRLRYPCYLGSMANGISSEALVEEAGQHGFLGFFGAAGLPLDRVEAAIDRLSARMGDHPTGYNLIHSPNDPDLEAALVELYLKRDIRLIEASAFLEVTLPLVRYRLHGIHQDSSGQVVTPHRIVAKVSRIEIGAHFFSPPPENWVNELVQRGTITGEQATLAARIPLAQDLTAEADSAGHTDNRPAITLLPTMLALRDRMQAQYGYDETLRVGLAGGIATPASGAAAFAMGSAYICTGSVNQACLESGACETVRQMLAETQQADVAMAPAADMFEMGGSVQVLKRGTMFSMRAAKLYQLYREHAGLDDLPEAERSRLEKQVFRAPFSTLWDETRAFFQSRDPRQIAEAESDPKHKMGLVFRWYLGRSSHWAIQGEPTRKVDYQIWCGPAMGAFNEWVRGSFLEKPENRRVVCVNLNILFGAALLLRCQQARSQGFALSGRAAQAMPRPIDEIQSLLD